MADTWDGTPYAEYDHEANRPSPQRRSGAPITPLTNTTSGADWPDVREPYDFAPKGGRDAFSKMA
jgi:hypothetical protein